MAIEVAMKPAATFDPVPASEPLSPVTSKLGGLPFTPLYTDWPSAMIEKGTKKRPMAFVGQFNFAEIVEAVPELVGVVPSQGLLQLFYDVEEFPWGTYPNDFNHIRINWFPDLEEYRHEAMATPVDSYPVKEFGLKFSYRPSFPEPYELDIPEEVESVYWETLIHDSHHQIAGYPSAIQDDPLDGFEQLNASNGAPWQLLLQIDSDEVMGLNWGDAGTIYLCIAADSLATADLSQSRLTLQCM